MSRASLGPASDSSPTPLSSETRFPTRPCWTNDGKPATSVELLELRSLDDIEVSVSTSDDLAFGAPYVMLFVQDEGVALSARECRRLAFALLHGSELADTVAVRAVTARLAALMAASDGAPMPAEVSA